MAAPMGGGRISTTTALSGLALVAVVVIARQTAGAKGLGFDAKGFTNIGTVLAPAVLLSLFIERATEVVITSWRTPEGQRLQHEVDLTTDAAQVEARRTLDFFRLETQRLAFIFSFVLAVTVALIGVRVIQPLLDPGIVDPMRAARVGSPDAMQWLWLMRVDVLLTGLLLAGGADGIHKIVTTFTAFLDATRGRAAASGGGGTQPTPSPQAAAPVQQHTAIPNSTPAGTGSVGAPGDGFDDGI